MATRSGGTVRGTNKDVTNVTDSEVMLIAR